MYVRASWVNHLGLTKTPFGAYPPPFHATAPDPESGVLNEGPRGRPGKHAPTRLTRQRRCVPSPDPACLFRRPVSRRATHKRVPDGNIWATAATHGRQSRARIDPLRERTKEPIGRGGSADK